ncbi:MAG: hypothetical protein ACRC2J_02255 [Microcoleaceae cyanobacterium]
MTITINWLLFSFLMIVHCLVGISAALLAKSKGYQFNHWIIGSLIGGSFALILAAVAHNQNEEEMNSQNATEQITSYY